MIPFQQQLRLLTISWVLFKHGMDDLLLASHLFRPLRFLRIFIPWLWIKRNPANRGIRIRKSLEELGPIYVKFGQILSTRRDLLPDDIADELAKLQDQVPAFPGAQAQALIEKAYGRRVDAVFATFDQQPMASASVAQVHQATLHSGQQVVVKVLRPDILPVIKRDIGVLYVVAHKLQRYWSAGKQLRPVEVVAEFERTLLDELDLMREAANANQLRRNFSTGGDTDTKHTGSSASLLYVPEVHFDYCRKNVLVIERIEGIPVGNIAALKDAGIDFKTLAENGVTIFFTQVFRDSFFHADMHPGNIFVSTEGQYIAVDFGIMGTLNHSDQRYLAENFHAFFNRDYRKVAQLHIDSGWVDKNIRVEEFEAAIRTVCEPIFDKPLKEISFGLVLLRLFQTARRFNIEVQPQLVLLQKTLLNIEGLGRQLYPDLDLWKTAKPFLNDWIAQQVGPKAFIKQFRDNFPNWLEQMPKLPNLIFETLQDAKDGKIQYTLNDKQLEQINNQIQQKNKRTVTTIIGSALLISAAIIYSPHATADFTFSSVPILSWALAGLGGFLIFLSRNKN